MKSQLQKSILLALTLIALGAGLAGAQAAPSHDRTFMHAAAQGGRAEVQLGQLAASRGKSADVRAFGRQMVTDHGKAGRELMQLASSLRIALPAGIGAHQKAVNKLQKLNGAAFDKAYLAAMRKGHKETITLFRDEMKHGHNAQVKAFAAKCLPVIEGHLHMLEGMKNGTHGMTMHH